jgi:hypothetical protein
VTARGVGLRAAAHGRTGATRDDGSSEADRQVGVEPAHRIWREGHGNRSFLPNATSVVSSCVMRVRTSFPRKETVSSFRTLSLQ